MSDNKNGVFSRNTLTRTETAVPDAGADNHLGILGSSGVWPSVTANTFLPGFTPGQGQLLMTHDNTCRICGSRNENVGVDETIAIGNTRTETVGNNENITVTNNRTEKVGGNESVTVAKNRTATVSMNEIATVALTRTHSVGVNEMINVGAAQELTVGGLQLVTVGLTQIVNVGTKQSVSAGTEIELHAPRIKLRAIQEIMIQCGAGTISINAAGIITISGPMVKVNC
jgi:type VI secretion system secreted protein VgrG